MRSMLAVAISCFLLLASSPGRADEPQAEPGPLPPSGRAAALAGGWFTTVGLGVTAIGIAEVASGCKSPCSEGVNNSRLFESVATFGVGVPMILIGIPTMSVGIYRTGNYQDALRDAVSGSSPLRREAAQKELAHNIKRDRIGMIVSGSIFGAFAIASIGTGLAILGAQSANDASGLQLTSMITAELAATALFPFLWCAGNYSTYKSMAAGTKVVPPISSVALAPVVTGSQYGLSLTGRWM